MKHLKHHETVVIRCDDIGARCGDVGAQCGDVCVWPFGAATSAIARRSFDATISTLDAETSSLDAETSALGAATSTIARSYRRYRRGVSGDIGDCGVGITPQMCNRVTNHGDMSTFSKPDVREFHIFYSHLSKRINLKFSWPLWDFVAHNTPCISAVGCSVTISSVCSMCSVDVSALITVISIGKC